MIFNNRKAQISGRLTALYVFLFCLILVSVIVPAVVGSFKDVSEPNELSVVYPLVNFFTEGLTLKILAFTINLNILDWFPQAMTDYLTDAFYCMTYIPDWFALPLLIVMAFSLVYVVITLIPTIGG